MAVSHGERERLHQAIEDAFDPDELVQLVLHKLDVKLDSITRDVNHSMRTFELIEWAHRHNRVEELYRHVQEARPDNEALKGLVSIVSRAQSRHRLDLVPSIWKAVWTVDDGRRIDETLQIRSWVNDNEFEGFGLSDHGTEEEPKTFNYSFSGRIEPTGVIIIEYRAEAYPFEGGKNIGVAIVEIKNEKRLKGYFAGYFYNKQPDEEEVDSSERTLRSEEFYIPFGRMTHYGGTVIMRHSGKGKA